jgi:hypothetical protein
VRRKKKEEEEKERRRKNENRRRKKKKKKEEERKKVIFADISKTITSFKCCNVFLSSTFSDLHSCALQHTTCC